MITLLLTGLPNYRMLNTVHQACHAPDITELIIVTWNSEAKNTILHKANLMVNTINSEVPCNTKFTILYLDQDNLPLSFGIAKGFYYQISQIRAGLSIASNEYALRIRTDESFYPLDNLISYFKSTLKQIVAITPFSFIPLWSYPYSVLSFDVAPWHIGDHLYLSSTLQLKRTFNYLYSEVTKDPLTSPRDYLTTQTFHPLTPHSNSRYCENIFMYSFLRTSGLDPIYSSLNHTFLHEYTAMTNINLQVTENQLFDYVSKNMQYWLVMIPWNIFNPNRIKMTDNSSKRTSKQILQILQDSNIRSIGDLFLNAFSSYTKSILIK